MIRPTLAAMLVGNPLAIGAMAFFMIQTPDEKRRDEILRRALNTPPKPKIAKPKPKGRKRSKVSTPGS
jgi:hypothetical protein